MKTRKIRFEAVWLILIYLSGVGTAQTLKADYQFSNTRASSVAGAPDLTDIGSGTNTFVTAEVDGISRPVLQFPEANGLRFAPSTGVIQNNNYTIVMLFEFDSLGTNRVLDFKNGALSGNGCAAYIQHRQFAHFCVGNTIIFLADPNVYVQVVVTRTAAGLVTGYINGFQHFQFNDTENFALIDANNALIFFKDFTQLGQSGGSVARIRLYDSGMTAGQVAALDRLPPQNYNLLQSVVASGGGSGSGGNYGITGTIGQSFAGSTGSGGNYSILSGFWASALEAASRRAPFDFDGDNKTDISIFRPPVGEWWYLKSSDGGNAAFQFGNSTDNITPGDFTGDGKTDIAFWRPSTGFWFILRSENFSFYSFPFGTAGDLPVVGDFDGDGKSDPGIFRPSTATWFILQSSGGTLIQQFGAIGDIPMVADYDGDGKTDIAIFRQSVGEWWIQRSTAGILALQFGTSSDKPVQGDYTGDGRADIAFWRPSTGFWFVLRSEDSSFYSFPFGGSGDIPAPGDFDGDGKFDAAIFRPSAATWYINQSSQGVSIVGFGAATDRPVPNAFVL